MKLLACLPLLLLAAAPVLPPAESEEIPLGGFRLWIPQSGPVHWVSGGVRIDIAPAPCDTPPQTEGCRFDPQNNQAEIVVSAPSLPQFRARSDGAASYYRVAVVQFDRHDKRPGIVIENDSGGSAGDVLEQLLLPEGQGFRTMWLPERWGPLQGTLGPQLTDRSNDGAVDFVLEDGRFAYAFGCGACTPRPPRIFTIRRGAIVDVSREVAFAQVYRKEMARLRPICTSRRQERNGACAAYVADAARIGEFDQAWALMLRHYERDPGKRAASADPQAASDFPESLRAFLKKTGYIPSK